MKPKTKTKTKTTIKNICVLIINIILLIGLVAAFFIYDNSYREKLHGQNIDEISNINQSSANIASTFFTSRESKLRDLALFIEENGMTLRESMDFIYLSNSDATKTFEIIGSDFSGYRLEKNEDGEYIPLDYSSGYGDFCKIIIENIKQTDSQVIGFAPEFTDGYTIMKSFALYNCLHLLDENGNNVSYTLMVVSNSADFIDMININSGYEKLETTIINKSGAYIIGNNAFKSNNFFSFLADFNDLTLDEQNAVTAEVLEKNKGTLSYLDGRGRDSVFVYTPVPNKDWYCVSVVPVAFFRNGGSEYSFTFIAIAAMTLLFTIDLLYLASLNRRLKISARNERIASAAKTDFLSRMSHDMRTPMNGIIGMTRLTQDIPNLPQEVQANLAEISDSSAYLLQLINDTLDMSKIESNKFTLNPETLNSSELIEHILSVIKPLANQKNITLSLKPVNAQFGYIRADRVRLQQIFLNILSNAVKFTPKNGKIDFAVECLKTENGIISVRISVEDTGCGMSAEFLEHIFEPFSQENTKITSSQEGTGLGMAIVKNLVELMGGKIEIESKVSIGTKVTVYLDFKCVANATEEKVYRESDAVSLKGKHVLLAEDHPLNADIAIRILAKKGIITEHAENGAIAVEMFSHSEIGYYDVVLMDIRMPEMNGLEATRHIRALERDDAGKVPIIAMTANAYAEDVRAALDAGMNAHLAKPIEPEVLYHEICQYIT